MMLQTHRHDDTMLDDLDKECPTMHQLKITRRISGDDFAAICRECADLAQRDQRQELIIEPPPGATAGFSDNLAWRINHESGITGIRARPKRARFTRLFAAHDHPGEVVVERRHLS